MDVKVLETYVARSPLELNRWARNYWSDDGKAPSGIKLAAAFK